MILWILVGGLEHEFYDFPYIGNVMIPTDELILFRGVGIPPTRIDSNIWILLDTTWTQQKYIYRVPTKDINDITT